MDSVLRWTKEEPSAPQALEIPNRPPPLSCSISAVYPCTNPHEYRCRCTGPSLRARDPTWAVRTQIKRDKNDMRTACIQSMLTLQHTTIVTNDPSAQRVHTHWTYRIRHVQASLKHHHTAASLVITRFSVGSNTPPGTPDASIAGVPTQDSQIHRRSVFTRLR